MKNDVSPKGNELGIILNLFDSEGSCRVQIL